jgi:hypothetical protein
MILHKLEREKAIKRGAPMNKLTLRIAAPIVLIIAVIAALLFLFANNVNQTKQAKHIHQAMTVAPAQSEAPVSEPPIEKDSPHELLETYISLMQQEQYSAMNELWPNTVAGNTEDHPIVDAAISDNLQEIRREDLDFTHHYKYHHDQIIAFFGEKAWERVKYEWTKIPAPESSAKWFDKSTGKEITFEQSVKLNEQYWNNVLEVNNWTERDVFTPEGVETPEEAAQREKNYAKYIDGEPTENINIEDYERYSVQFSFDGHKDAKSGEHQFKISITNKQGKWALYDMLSWNPPLAEPTSDI